MPSAFCHSHFIILNHEGLDKPVLWEDETGTLTHSIADRPDSVRCSIACPFSPLILTPPSPPSSLPATTSSSLSLSSDYDRLSKLTQEEMEVGKKQFEQHRENGDLDDDEDEDEDPDMGHDVMGAAAASASSDGNGMMPPPTPSMAHSTLRSETPGFKGVRLHHRAVSGEKARG